MQRGAAAVLREACSIRRSTLVVLARRVRRIALLKEDLSFYLCGCAQAAQGLDEGQCVNIAIFWSCGVGHACGCEHSRVIVKFPLRLEVS